MLMSFSWHNWHTIRLLPTLPFPSRTRWMPSIWEEAVASWRTRRSRKDCWSVRCLQCMIQVGKGLPRLIPVPAGARRSRRQAYSATVGGARRSGRFRLRFWLSRSGPFHRASWLLLDVGVIFRQSLKPCEASRLARVRYRTERQGRFCPNPHSLERLQVISLYARVLSETGIFKTFLGWRSSATASAGWKSLR